MHAPAACSCTNNFYFDTEGQLPEWLGTYCSDILGIQDIPFDPKTGTVAVTHPPGEWLSAKCRYL